LGVAPVLAAPLGEAVAMIRHPMLLDPARRRAFDDLLEHPCGTERTWSARWGWSRSKVTRFLAALERHQLADLEKSEWGTLVRMRAKAEPQPNHGRTTPHLFTRAGTEPGPVHSRTRAEPQPGRLGSLGSSSTDLVSRSGSYGVELIRALNRFGRIRFGDEFDEISDDNRSSLAAARSLEASGFDLDDVVDELRKAVTLFNPSKHGRGNLPGSLAYFEKGLRKALAARAANDAREQNEMVLLATIAGEPEAARSPGKPERISAVIPGVARRVGGR
jgi:hypothetical protein